MSTKKISRRDFLRLAGLTGGAAALAACAPKMMETAVPATEAATEAAVATEAPALPKKAADLLKAAGVPLPGSPEAFKGWETPLPDVPAGYPLAEPITITTARPTDSEVVFLPKGDDLDNNVWTRSMAALFGVNFVNKLTWVESDEQAQKYNLAMAANDLPDILQDVPDDIFVQMVEADMLLELGPIWDQYASPKWKAAVEAAGAEAWRYTTVNGKRYGLPHVHDAGHDDAVLWVRKDWLDKLGLKAPETWQDVHDVALAFAEAKLGGPDTYGMLACNEFRKTWFGTLDPLWCSYGISVGWGSFGWSKAADGSLEYDGIKPAVKDVLAILQQWYADGVFRKDFYAIGPDQLTPDLSSGRVGLQFNPVWGANRASVSNTGADWLFLDIPIGGPAGRRKQTQSPWNNGRFCCPKTFEHAKEWIELTNWRIELEETAGTRMHGWEGINYNLKDGVYESTDADWAFWTVGPLGTRTGGNHNSTILGEMINHNITEWEKIPADQRDAFQAAQFADPVSVLRAKATAYIISMSQKEGLVDEFTGQPTPTMQEIWSDLVDQETEVCLSIIIGQKPLEAFDEYVANWKAAGGEQVVAEVNEWWKSIQ